MTRSRRGRWAAIARGVLLLAAILLLPLATTLQMPRQTSAQAVAQDSLWVGGMGAQAKGVGVCADPSSSAALSGCFASAASVWTAQYNMAVTDGVNVYFANEYDGGLSCPIVDLGTNCIRIMAGPFTDWNGSTTSLAAANGYLWIGQNNGQIYRCPSNLPYGKQNKAPSECVLLDDAGKRGVYSLLLANGTLYAGLGPYQYQGGEGLLWSCSPDTVNSCATLDSYGSTAAYSLAAGGGYLWAGLGNGIVWRCDLNAANACANWEQAGDSVNPLSYDGQGTLYAAIKGNNKNPGMIWSCPTAYANGCSNLLSNVYGISVAAGAGSVFSSTTASLYFGTSPFTAASNTEWRYTDLLYLPADGPVGVGGVKVTMSTQTLGKRLEQRCDQSPANRIRAATVTITGPNGFAKTLRFSACTLSDAAAVAKTFDLLDPGDYTVTVQAGKHSGTTSFTIVQDKTKTVNVKLTRGIHH